MSVPALTSNSCPSLEDLLSALEGDLPIAEHEALTAHVRGCAACRVRLGRIEKTMAAVADFTAPWEHDGTESIRPPMLSPPRTEEFKGLLQQYKQDHTIRHARAAFLRRWLPVAALIPLVIFGVVLFRLQTAVLSADELMERAERYERSQPTGLHQVVEITFTPAEAAGTGVHPAQPLSGRLTLANGRITSNGTEAAAALVRRAHEWRISRALLSVEGFQRWRRDLGDRGTSKVVVPRDATDRLILAVTASRGELREVQLVIQRDSYQVVRQTLLFTDGRRLDIKHVDRSTDGTPESAFEPAAEPTPKPLEPAPSRASDAGSRSVPAPSVITSHRGLAALVARRFPQNRERQRFVPELIGRVGSARNRLNDLCARAQPATAERDGRAIGAVGEGDAESLRIYEALRRDLEGLNVAFSIIFGSHDRDLPAEGLPPDWRRRVREASPHAARLQGLTAELLAYDDVLPPDGSKDIREHRMYGRIESAFSALWKSVNGPP